MNEFPDTTPSSSDSPDAGVEQALLTLPLASDSEEEPTTSTEPGLHIASGLDPSSDEDEDEDSSDLVINALELENPESGDGDNSDILPFMSAVSDDESHLEDDNDSGEDQVASILNAIESLRSSFEGRLDKLALQFDREVRAETTRERVVDRLHAELQEYKNDLLMKTLRPIFIDLIQLHDDIGKMADSFRTETNDSQSQTASRTIQVLQDVQLGIEDTLYRQGVEPFPDEAQPGSTFDARRQRAVATVATDQADLGKKVAARLRKGFQSGDKVIRPEIVSVYAFKP